MEFFDDIFAGWSFEIGGKVRKSDFLELLTILDTSSILKLSSVNIDFKQQPFKSIDQAADLCIECFEKGKVLVLSGETILQTESDKRTFDKAIVFTLEPPYQGQLALISIDTYTDAWMPIGCLSEALQIDSGIANSKRLQEVLRQIARLGFVKKVIPSENEYFHDYMVHQVGFGLFYKRSLESINGIERKEYNKITPFLLSN